MFSLPKTTTRRMKETQKIPSPMAPTAAGFPPLPEVPCANQEVGGMSSSSHGNPLRNGGAFLLNSLFSLFHVVFYSK